MIDPPKHTAYHVTVLDTFEAFDAFDSTAMRAAEYPLCELATFDEAVAVAQAHGGTMTLAFVLDDAGRVLYQGGEP